MPIDLLQLSSYVAFAIFVVVVLGKARSWMSMPLHLRWELYPVPHEKGRNVYGGSYLEEVDWVTKPRETTFVGEMKELLQEMLFIKRVFEYKRSLWWLTFPFHFGIYLILGWFALLFVGGLTEVYANIDVASTGHWWGQLLYYLTILAGGFGIILGTIGTLGLLARRFADYELREYSSGSEFFNLVFILAVFALGAASWLLFDRTFMIALQFMSALVAFDSAMMPELNSVILAHVILLELLFVYIPFTKMTHFVGKYFTYHTVLWEDTPNIKGSKMEKDIQTILTTYKVTWDAPHIKKGTWVDNAIAKPEDKWGEWKYE